MLFPLSISQDNGETIKDKRWQNSYVFPTFECPLPKVGKYIFTCNINIYIKYYVKHLHKVTGVQITLPAMIQNSI